MKRYLHAACAAALLCLALSGTALGQRSRLWNRYYHMSYGVQAGIAWYQGDLDDNAFDFAEEGSNPFKQKSFRPAFGGQLNFHFNPFMHWRLMVNHGWIGGADSLNTAGGRKERNLHFRSAVTEASFQLIIEPFARNDYSRFRKRWGPYVYFGVGFFHFNPKAKPDPSWESAYPRLFPYKDRWYELQPLGTSGQNLPESVRSQYSLPEPYSRTQICIPFGVGVRRRLSRYVDLKVEFGVRKTFTDFLDDVGGKYYAPPEHLVTINSPDGRRGFLFADRSLYTNYGKDRQFQLGESPSLFYGGSAIPDEIRADPSQNDWYGFISIGITKIIKTR